MSLGDWPGDPDGKWPIWVLTRHKDEYDKWTMPDFGYWSWPLDVVGDYTQFRHDVRENELSWKENTRMAAWLHGAAPRTRIRCEAISYRYRRT
jgi:hypothetical protein